MRIEAHIQPWRRCVAFQVTGRDFEHGPARYVAENGVVRDDGKLVVGTKIVMEPMPPEGHYDGETFCLDLEAAQYLMDSLWRCGLRPTEGTGSAGALAATESHLKDMRDLVFRLMNDHEMIAEMRGRISKP